MALLFNGTCWQVESDQPEALVEEVLKKIDVLIDGPSCQRIKETTGRRTIYKLETRNPGLPPYLFIKTLSRPSFPKQIKYLFRASRTRQEWKMAKVFRKLDLPVARALAVGEKKRLGLLTFDVIILEYLEEHLPLDQYLLEKISDTERAGRRDEVMARFADLVRRLHDIGILQRDFKPDSIMIKASDQGFEFRFVDLESVRYLKRRLAPRERIKNLSNIFQTFERVCSPRDYRDFILNYFREDNLSQEETDRIYDEICSRAENLARRWTWKLRSWVRGQNELYHNFTQGPWRIYAHESMPELELKKILQAPDGIREKEISILRKRESEPGTIEIRRCRPAFSLNPQGFFGGALYGFENSTVFRHRGIPYIRPFAAFERRLFGRMRTGYILSEIPAPLLSLKQSWEKSKAEPVRSAGFFSRLGALLARLQKMGIRCEGTIDRVIKVVDKEKREPEFLLHNMDMIFLPKRGSAPSQRDMVSEIAELLELDTEGKNKLNQHFLASGQTGLH